jgi:hypothetical protein
MTLVESIRAIRAIYPDAIVECPDGRYSVSAYPRGPELSRQCNRAKAAWMDAARKIGQRKCVPKSSPHFH